jgi:hypothetical protein
MDGDLEAKLQLLVDEAEIARVLKLYCRGVDRADIALLERIFLPDATIDYGMFAGKVRDTLFPALRGAHLPDEPLKLTRHTVEMEIIDIRGDQAFSESFYISYHARKDGFDEFNGGRYLDRLTKSLGAWRIAHRNVVFDWSRVLPGVEKWWDRLDASKLTFGRRDKDDPVYRHLAV